MPSEGTAPALTSTPPHRRRRRSRSQRLRRRFPKGFVRQLVILALLTFASLATAYWVTQ